MVNSDVGKILILGRIEVIMAGVVFPFHALTKFFSISNSSFKLSWSNLRSSIAVQLQ